MEALGAVFLMAAIVLLAGSWIMLLFAASNDDFSWALCALFVPPLAYLYGLWSWQKAKDAILMAIAGWILLLLHFAVS